LKAVILVGGLGTRLLPLTCKTPKAMMPILNQPFMEHLILYLKHHGVSEVILAMGYLPDPIQKGLGDGSSLGVKLTYSVEPKALGTAGAVKYAEKYLDKEPFFVFNGDVITEIDLTDMLQKHRQVKPKASIALTPVDNPSVFGVVETDGRGMVRRFIEKPPPGTETTNMINAGIYILETEVLDIIPPDTFFMFERSVYPPMLEKGESIMIYPSSGYWIDIGSPQKYMQVQYDLLSETGNRVITQGRSRIHPMTVFEGPVMIGHGCTIERVHIKGPVVIGPGCKIGLDSVIEKSVVWANTHVGEKVILKGCVVASGCFIGNGGEISEGTVIGDNVRLGDGCKTAPNTKIWPDQKFAPKTNLAGDVGKPPC
jgi:mannose-1-phosphate guanylyltransferase